MEAEAGSNGWRVHQGGEVDIGLYIDFELYIVCKGSMRQKSSGEVQQSVQSLP